MHPRLLKQFLPYFYAILGFAVLMNALAPSLTTVAGEFGRRAAELDWVLSGAFGGFFVSMACCIALMERIGKDRVLTVGLLLGGLSLEAMATISDLSFFAFAAFLMGLGCGAIEVTAMACLAEGSPPAYQRRMMNLSQVFFCVGAIGTPLLVSTLLSEEMGRQGVFRLLGVFPLVGVLFMIRKVFSREPRAAESALHAGPWVSRLKSPWLWAVMIGMLLYVLIECAFFNWICTYFEEVLHAPLWASGMQLSIFWSGLLAGRILYTMFHFPITDRQSIILFYGIALAGGASLLLLHSPLAAGIAVFVTGGGLSIIWPTILSLVSARFPQHSGPLVSLVICSGTVGLTIGPAVVGRITLWTGSFRLGFAALCILMAAGLTLFHFLREPSEADRA